MADNSNNSNIPVENLTSGIKLKDKIGYACGDMAGVMTFGLIGSFLQMFYTDVLKIPIGQITILFLVSRIWDAINDPIWGTVIDRRKPSKNGKFRPYLKWLSLPLAIAGFLMFVPIEGLSANQYLVYAYITYIAYGMLYTAVTIPYGSLASVITSDEMERSSLSVFRSLGAGIGGLPATIVLPLFVYTTSLETSEQSLDGTRLMIGVGVMCIISVFVYQICYKYTVERITSLPVPNGEKPNLLQSAKFLLKNKPFVALCLSTMFLLATQQYTQTIYNYLFVNYFEKGELYSMVTVCTYLPMLLLMPFMGKIIKQFGKKEVCAYGMLFSAIMNIILLVIKTHSVYVYLAFCFLMGFGMTFLVLEIWALVTDVIDYQEFLTGKREEGTSYAFYSFARKLGQTLAGVLATQVLAFIGYNNTDSENIVKASSETIDKMYTVSTLVPAIMCACMFVFLQFFYPLGKKKLSEFHAQKSQQ